MTNQLRTMLERATILLVAAALGLGLFATGVWAGSSGSASESPSAVQARGSFWNFDPQTGSPTGPAGQPDFWNYSPHTGAKISNSSAGVAPSDLGALFSAEP